jgi:hypothetical protein
MEVIHSRPNVQIEMEIGSQSSEGSKFNLATRMTVWFLRGKE